MQTVTQIENTADLRKVLGVLMLDILSKRIELPRAREANRSAKEINNSLANDIRASLFGLERARADPERPPLAISPVKL